MKPKSQVAVVAPKTKAQKVPLRWGGHLPLAIRIALSGSDEGGKTFSESTQTVGVDRRGARIVTSHQIALGTEVTVENSAVHRIAKAKVVWRGDGTSAQKSEVVVELLDPTESVSIWGIKFPSQDKKTAPPAPTPTRAAEPAGPGEPVATSHPGFSAVLTDRGTESLVEGGELTEEPEGLMVREQTQKSPNTLAAEAAGEALAALQDHAETLRRNADEAVKSIGLTTEKALVELRVSREQMEANFRASADDYDRRLAELSGSGIENLRHQSESLFEVFQRKMQTTLDELQQKGATALSQSLQETVGHARQDFADQLPQQAQAVWKSMSDELKASLAPMVDEAGSRIADASQSTVERVEQAAKAAIEQCRIEAGREFEKQTVAASRTAESGAESIRVASEEAFTKLEAARQQMETAFHASTDAFRQGLAELSASGIEGLHRQSNSLLQSFESQLLQNTLQEFQQKVAQQVADQIPNITDELLERSAQGLQKQADETVHRLSEELKASRVALVDETRQQIAALTQVSVESFGSQVQAIDEQSRHQLTETASQCAHKAMESVKLATDGIVAGLQAAQENVQRELLESFQGQLRTALRDFEQRSTTDLTGQLQGLAERLQRSCTEQLQRHADDALKSLSEELLSSRMALVDDTREQIAALAHKSVESLGRQAQATEEESRVKLHQSASQCAAEALESIKLTRDAAITSLQSAQGTVQASTDAHTEEYRKRVAELSANGLEELGIKTGALIESFQSQLQSTLNDFQHKSTTDLTGQLGELADRLQRAGAEQLQKHAGDALTASKEELEASTKALVNETREQVAAVVQASLESLGRRTQATEEASGARLEETASQRVQAALGSITLAADEGLAGLQAAQTKVLAGLNTQAEECEKRLNKLSTSAVQEFGAMARLRLEAFKGELQSTLDDFHDQGTTELTNRLQSSAENLQQRCAEELRKQSEGSLKSLSDELQTSGTRLVYEARLRLTDTARELQESFTQELRATTEQARGDLAQTASLSAGEARDSIGLAREQAVAGLKAAQEATRASFAAEADIERKRLQDLSSSSKEELQRTADSVLIGFGQSLKQKAGVTSEEAGHQLRAMLEELASGSLRESQAKHEELVKKQRKIFQDNIDYAAQGTADRFARKLTGLEQEHGRGSVVSKLAWGLVALAPTILFVCLATRPIMKLRVDPPAEFLSAVSEAAPERRAAEERVARAYWDWAYLHLQRKYPFAAQLPEDPPMEMDVYGNDVHYSKTNKREEHSDPTGLEAEVAKRRYWQKLRQAWAMPQAWEKSSMWDRK